MIPGQDPHKVQLILDQSMQILGYDQGNIRLVYRKPYLEWMETVPYPRHFNMTAFNLLSSEGDQSTVEHVSHFVVQCGDASHVDYWNLRSFPLLLPKTRLHMVYVDTLFLAN